MNEHHTREYVVRDLDALAPFSIKHSLAHDELEFIDSVWLDIQFQFRERELACGVPECFTRFDWGWRWSELGKDRGPDVFALSYNGIVQGLIKLGTAKSLRCPSRSLLMIENLMAAPWNRKSDLSTIGRTLTCSP